MADFTLIHIKVSDENYLKKYKLVLFVPKCIQILHNKNAQQKCK